KLVFANDAAAQVLGFPSSEALLAASPEERLAAFELLDEDGEPLALERLPGRRALAGFGSEEQILRYRIRATGEERWSAVRAAQGGNPAGDARPVPADGRLAAAGGACAPRGDDGLLRRLHPGIASRDDARRSPLRADPGARPAGCDRGAADRPRPHRRSGHA